MCLVYFFRSIFDSNYYKREGGRNPRQLNMAGYWYRNAFIQTKYHASHRKTGIFM